MISVGKTAHIKKGYCGKRIKVRIVDVQQCKRAGEKLYFTAPIVGSGRGIPEHWFESDAA